MKIAYAEVYSILGWWIGENVTNSSNILDMNEVLKIIQGNLERFSSICRLCIEQV